MSKQSTHVLLIEDSQGDADLIRMRLLESNSDLQVSCADRLSTGLAALAIQPPAVVLLDLNLPDSHGADTFRKVLNKAPGVPVVVVSGVNDEELAVQAVHQGVQDYLVKGTFDSKQLARALRYAIERQSVLTALDIGRTQPEHFKGSDLRTLEPLAKMETISRSAGHSYDPQLLCAVLRRKQLEIKHVQVEIEALNSAILLLADENELSITTRPHRPQPDTRQRPSQWP